MRVVDIEDGQWALGAVMLSPCASIIDRHCYLLHEHEPIAHGNTYQHNKK